MRNLLFFFLFLPFIAFSQLQQCSDTIFSPPGADWVVYCVTNTSCHDTCNGKITINVQGTNGPYSFAWDGLNFVVDDDERDSLCANNYIVPIMDANGNLVNNTYQIDLTSPPNYTVFIIDTLHPTCFGYSDGVISVSIGGATSPYDYSWFPTGYNTDSIGGLDTGTHILTTTDFNGCIKTDTFTLENPLKVNSNTVADTLSCIGECDGIGIVIPENGTAPYTYDWLDINWVSNGGVNDTVDNLCYGLNRVIIIDSIGCLDTNEVFISNPDTLFSNITIDDACYQSCDGELSVTIEGGQSPYTISWIFVGDTISSDTTTGPVLCAGDYMLVYSDINFCTDTVDITVSERDSFTLVLPAVTDESCNESCDGEVTAHLLFQHLHTPPFSYNWYAGASVLGTDSLVSGLCSDSISLELRDERGCRDTFDFFVAAGDSMYFDTLLVEDNMCYGETNGSISLINFNGGVNPVYSWINGQDTIITSASGINGLFEGTYSLHVEDERGCTLDSANIQIDAPDSLYAVSSVQDVLCNGEDGLIDVDIFGGSGVYFVSRNGLIIDTVSVDTVPAGMYIYTIVDTGTSCPPIVDTLIVNEPAALMITDDSLIHVKCHGENTGEIHLTVNGGVLPYMYSIDGSIYQSQSYFNNLVEGQYSITVKDGNDCLTSILVSISEPLTPLAGSLESPVLLCFGDTGTITLQVSGGTPNYSFLWDNGVNSQNLANADVGLYTCTITDVNGCELPLTTTVVEPDPIVVVPVIKNLDCFEDETGDISITVSGGTPPLTYSWTGNNLFTSASQDIENLSSGNYTVTITDDNECPPHSETFFVDEPEELELSVDQEHVDCYGNSTGGIDLTVEGGTPNYSFLWSNGHDQEDLSNVIAGTYTVIVEDENDCIDSISGLINQSTPIVYELDVENLVCNDISDGEISVLGISGGNPEYSYSIDGGYTSQSSSVFSDLEAGNYSLLIEDEDGCTVSEAILIDEPTPFSIIDENIQNIEGCYGDETGSISVVLEGSSPPYTYEWRYSDDLLPYSTALIDDLQAGMYELIVTDINNCKLEESYYISEPDGFDLNASITLPCEEPYGNISVFVTGGTEPFSYEWYFLSEIIEGEITSSLNNMMVGEYLLKIEDDNGCDTLAVYDIVFDSDCIFIPSGFTPNGDGVHDVWEIEAFENASDVLVKVYNRWGQEVFGSAGSYTPWDGTSKGVNLPTAAYYYVIEIDDNLFKGTVTIKR